MDNSLALVKETKKKSTQQVTIRRECPVTDDVIFEATDDCARTGWFLRLKVSGLYPRRVGPYRTKEQAIDAWEAFITEVELELFVNLHNDMDSTQVYVVEGIPLLNGRCAQKGR